MEFFTFEWVSNPQIWLSLITLSALEIVLGIDNLVFLTILTNRLPPEQRPLGRKIGLTLALGTRLILLATLAWIVKLTDPLFTMFDHGFSWRDLILIGGGLFLFVKAVHEMHETMEGEEDEAAPGEVSMSKVYPSFASVVVQIAIIDIIFSLDSVITAVGMADTLWVMVVAVIAAMIIMLIASNPLADFVNKHPTVKMLALSLLLLIGVFLIADGFGLHIPKGYLYFALGFSIAVEALNHWMRRKRRRT
ncbi:MAG: TerC family protein [Betaproteobacteria bacterium]|nr:TerC family protein [Betaproteobacteria bacterium]